MAAAAKQAKSHTLAASSIADGLDKIELYGECAPTSRALLELDLTNAHKPIKHSNTQAKPPILVLVGAAAKQSEKKANARAGKGR